MPEEHLTLSMPSGYEASERLEQLASINETVLPWLQGPYELTVTKCRLGSGEEFLIASALGTHPKLADAARAMTDKQRQITDNMFYSRLPAIVINGYSPNIETMPKPITDFPVYVMRNNGGQRVYFSRISLGLAEEQQCGPVIVRLAVCDKNKQQLAISVISGMGSRQGHYMLSK